MSVLAIVLARKNSKGLKNKNIRFLDGKPLIYHTINLLKKSKMIDKIVVSTDSIKIQKIAIRYGAEAPFLRPKKLSTDRTTTEKALKHSLLFVNKKMKFYPKIIMYVQITEPFRKLWMIEKCIKALKKNKKLDTSFMAKKFYKNIWKKKKNVLERITKEKYGLPRQIKKKYFREDTGIACATRPKVILSEKRIGQKILPIYYEHDFDYLDIHNENDLRVSNYILKNKLFKIS